MANAAREMIRTYFGIVGNDSDLRLQKIRELRAREADAQPQGRRASTAASRGYLPLRGRPIG
jgi:hypothetical protein